MIFGIKQIEKQFPGFEALFTGGSVFDMREVFKKYQLSAGFDEELKSFYEEISDNYWDIIKPPTEKMYIIVGDNKGLENERFYTEYACGIKKEKDILFCTPIVHEFFKQYSKGLAFNMGIVLISQNKNPLGTRHSITSTKEENMGIFRKMVLGKGGDDIFKDSMGYNNLLNMMKENVFGFVLSIVTSLFYLNIRNIKQRSEYISGMRSFYYPKTWGREYKVLSFSQTLIEQSPGPDFPPGYHVRGHFQRGHFKRKPKGVYWWNPHWRGDFSKGIVMKDYKFKGET